MDTNTTPTGMRLHGIGERGATLEPLDHAAMRWDGADEASTNMVRLDRASAVMGHDVRAYIQVEITGRKVRTQRVDADSPYTAFGLKVRFRFTDPDSSGDWHDGVLTAWHG